MPTLEQVTREAADERAKKEAARFKAAGGPAFPHYGGAGWMGPGMSLRDYFAAKAMQGLLSMPNEWRDYFRRDGAGSTWKIEASRAAYALADAMLKAREA